MIINYLRILRRNWEHILSVNWEEALACNGRIFQTSGRISKNLNADQFWYLWAGDHHVSGNDPGLQSPPARREGLGQPGRGGGEGEGGGGGGGGKSRVAKNPDKITERIWILRKSQQLQVSKISINMLPLFATLKAREVSGWHLRLRLQAGVEEEAASCWDYKCLRL